MHVVGYEANNNETIQYIYMYKKMGKNATQIDKHSIR
jgi:hypothetical protein